MTNTLELTSSSSKRKSNEKMKKKKWIKSRQKYLQKFQNSTEMRRKWRIFYSKFLITTSSFLSRRTPNKIFRTKAPASLLSKKMSLKTESRNSLEDFPDKKDSTRFSNTNKNYIKEGPQNLFLRFSRVEAKWLPKN